VCVWVGGVCVCSVWGVCGVECVCGWCVCVCGVCVCVCGVCVCVCVTCVCYVCDLYLQLTVARLSSRPCTVPTCILLVLKITLTF